MTGLLAIDVGNTNTVLGVYDGDNLRAHWRVQTNARRTSDEYALLVSQLFAKDDIGLSEVSAAIVASVVPPAVRGLSVYLEGDLGVATMVVGPGTKTGMQILYENPREVGADRIVNAVAAYQAFPQGCIIVDFGTATTWDVVNDKGQYLGGVIAPGVKISAEALYQRASKLPRVELARPSSVIGRNTIASMQSGLLFGYAGMVDSVVERIRAEVAFRPACVATGGLAELIARESTTIESTDEMLTLRGLRLLYERNC